MNKPTHGSSNPNYRPTERSRPRRHPPGAPPRSNVRCSGRGSSPLQRPIRQNSKSGKKAGVRSYHYIITNRLRQGKGKCKGCSRTSNIWWLTFYRNRGENQEFTLTSCHKPTIHLPTQI